MAKALISQKNFLVAQWYNNSKIEGLNPVTGTHIEDGGKSFKD